MKIPLLIIALFSFQQLFSQQVLTVSDMPEDNDTARYSNINPLSNIDFRSTGPNYLWDFSDITPNSQDFYEYENIFEINVLFLGIYGFGAFGRQTADQIGFGPVSFDEIYTYYEKSNSSFKSIGRSLNISGIPAPARNSDDETIYKLPLSFGDTNTDDFELSYPDVGVGILYSINGTRSYEVDGWGTIITPLDTFECIRVKHTITETNELEISGFPLNITQIREEYIWWSKGVKTPVFEVVRQDLPLVGFVTSSIRYKDTYQQCLNIRPNIAFSADDTTINVGESVNLDNTTLCGNGLRNWNITPSTGVSFINGTDFSTAEPEVQFDNPGLYTVSLTERNTLGPNNLRKEDYIEVIDPTSVKGIKREDFKIFPNPSDDFVQVQSNETVENIELYNLSGKLLFQENYTAKYNYKIDLSQFSEGIYLLILNKKYRHKIVVLR